MVVLYTGKFLVRKTFHLLFLFYIKNTIKLFSEIVTLCDIKHIGNNFNNTA